MPEAYRLSGACPRPCLRPLPPSLTRDHVVPPRPVLFALWPSMDLSAAEAAAAVAGVVLVKCAGCESGFKGVFPAFRSARWRSGYWCPRRKGTLYLSECDSRFEAALQLARQLGGRRGHAHVPPASERRRQRLLRRPRFKRLRLREEFFHSAARGIRCLDPGLSFAVFAGLVIEEKYLLRRCALVFTDLVIEKKTRYGAVCAGLHV